MEFSKLLLLFTFFITFQILLPSAFSIVLPGAARRGAATTTFPATTIKKSNLFRAYIGAGVKNVQFSDGFKNVQFSDVPILPGVEFHFMLAFAVDCTSSDSPYPTDGIFNVFWDKETLTPAQVSAIKSNNQNVKVVLSIGGDTCGQIPVKFNATSVNTWVSNAVTSLTKIIKDYNLDGIDIDYEQFIASPDTFSECMGQLVYQLKEYKTISIASIAPWEDDQVQSHYQALWKNYAHVFDYVNFQFYAYDKGVSKSLFLEYFDRQSSNYEGGNMLVGYSNDVDAGGLSIQDGFFDACKTLKNSGKLSGIFVWSADNSKANGFTIEKQSQTVVAATAGPVWSGNTIRELYRMNYVD